MAREGALTCRSGGALTCCGSVGLSGTVAQPQSVWLAPRAAWGQKKNSFVVVFFSQAVSLQFARERDSLACRFLLRLPPSTPGACFCPVLPLVLAAALCYLWCLPCALPCLPFPLPRWLLRPPAPAPSAP